MKIATWNVNSLKVRLPQVEQWLAGHAPDTLVLQEIKQTDDMFPVSAFADAGYQGVSSGQKTYNGVAIVSRSTPQDVVTDLPGFDDPQRRVLAATVDGCRIVNLYVPNGKEVGSDKYEYKLAWLKALRDYLSAELDRHEHVAVLGDFNIAPEDRDVYDPEKWGDAILCSPAERAALREILELGFSDVFRQFEQEDKSFSWWDYRAAGFRRNAGLRIDLILANPALAEKCTDSYIDRAPRAWERPSDHAPVVAEFTL